MCILNIGTYHWQLQSCAVEKVPAAEEVVPHGDSVALCVEHLEQYDVVGNGSLCQYLQILPQ